MPGMPESNDELPINHVSELIRERPSPGLKRRRSLDAVETAADEHLPVSGDL